MVFSFPGSGQGSPGWCGGSVFGRACLIAGGCHPVLHDRSAVLVTPLWVRRLGFWRRVLTGWFCVPVCCGVRFCGAGRGKKSVSSVFSCSPGTVGHSAGAGWLDFSWVWVRPGKSPVRCWTGKSGSGWGLGPVSLPAPLELGLGWLGSARRWSLLRLFGAFLRCWEKIQRNRTKFLIEQNFEQVRWRPRRRPGCSGRR